MYPSAPPTNTLQYQGFQQQPQQPYYPQQQPQPQFQHHHQPAGAVQGAFQMIQSEMSGKMLNVSGGNATAGAPVIIWPGSNPPTPNELWQFQDAGNGYFYIASALNPNMVLAVEGQGPGARVTLHQRKHQPEASQLFLWAGQCLQSALGQHVVLDVQGADTNDGAQVIVWDRDGAQGAANQRWRIV